MINLLNCPFCGGEPKLKSTNIMIHGVSKRVAWVFCKQCGSRTNYMLREQREHYVRDAVSSWNGRWSE